MGIRKTFFLVSALASMAMAATIYEAELGTLGNASDASQNPAIASDASASGGKYVKMNGGSISMTVTAAETKNYAIKIHYKNNYGGSKENILVVGNNTIGSIVFPETQASTFEDVESVARLNAGQNTISINNSWGWIDVDYIEVSDYVAEAFNISSTVVTAGATEEAQKLYTFLVNNFQKKTISGVMTGDVAIGTPLKSQADVVAVHTAGGKYPVLVGFDFLFATGKAGDVNSWNQDYTNETIKLAKELWDLGGIPAFTWHWKDPSNAVDAFYIEGAQVDGDEFTTFDYRTGFKAGTTEWDTNSDTYKQIVEDIDKISDLFLTLQEQKVAAIFRPLHECGGAWFWWSAVSKSDVHSGAEFVALYRLVYDRMVKVNGVKNLVWNWNPQTAALKDWNPGEEYFDILSVDIYNNANDHASNAAAFNGLKSNISKNKILALSENGPIPDVENMHNDEAVWSWWMPWYESWSAGFVSKTAASVWQSNFNDERILTLDKMPGWNGPISISKTASINPLKWSVQGKSLLIHTSKNDNVKIEVYGMNGAHIKTLAKGTLSLGSHRFSLEDLSQGLYMLRVEGSQSQWTKAITIR
jgi:hypothetical protein